MPKANFTWETLDSFQGPWTHPVTGNSETITKDQKSDGESDEWSWFDQSDVTLEAENVSPEFIELLTGAAITPIEEVTEGPVNITAERKDGTKLDFVLYKVKFESFKFNPFNRWYKKLLRVLVGKKRAQKFLLRRALTISYSGKALISDEFGTVQGNVDGFGPALERFEG